MNKDIIAEIDRLSGEMIELSTNIHSNPELGLEEYKSSGFIKTMLKQHGFAVEDGSGGMETAFKARFKGRADGPRVAFLAEYDSLPGMGHACGHNLIAAVSTGAAIALSKIMGDFQGEILLIGTPAEETKGGKIRLLEKGAFDDVDYALMTHPSTVNLVNRGGLATTTVTVRYKGRAAHSASPEKGINALSAVIQTFNLLDSLRAQMPLKTNINGIITSGGTVTNIIPDYAECRFSVRAATLSDLQTVYTMIKKTMASIEGFIGVTGEIEHDTVYSERYSNLVIDNLFKKYMEEQGEKVLYPDPNAKIGSSDIGNVSLKIPAIHAYIKITDGDEVAHTKDFAAISNTPRAHEAMIKAAKALAQTGYDILTDISLREKIQREFDAKVPRYENVALI
ncbi:MAG: M20 family metallopeptidase [Clostridiaceae bacterium]|nr:M20 family metallopeptidase [Clostridiaceae bacterium]